MTARGLLLGILILFCHAIQDARANLETVPLDHRRALDFTDATDFVADNGLIGGPDAFLTLSRGGALDVAAPPEDQATPLWIALRVVNDTPRTDWVVLLRQQSFMARVDVWVYDQEVVETHQAAGIGLPDPAAQPRFALGYELPVTLPADAVRTIVLRLEPTFYRAAPELAPADVARVESAGRRMLFPLLLGAYLGIAAFHVVVFCRFGGLANVLFAGMVTAIFADWFLWLGGVHDLGIRLTVEDTIALSRGTWLAATFFVVLFCTNFLAPEQRRLFIHAATLGLFFVFVAFAHYLPSPDLQLLSVNIFTILFASIIYALGVFAIKRKKPGVRMALIAFTINTINELSVFVSISSPKLTEFYEWMISSIGLFDVTTLLSQIFMNGLFSLALWEQVRSRVQAREAAVQAERAKAVQLAQLGHDIRSPLHAVQSVIGALTARAPVHLANPRHVEAVQSSMRAIVDVLDDIVELARTGQTTPGRRNPVDLRQLVTDAAAVTRVALDHRPVDLRLDMADDLPPLILADGVAIRRVLGNLLSNATRVTSRGTVSVAVSWSDIGAGGLRLAVSDTGPGLTARRLAELFGPAPVREGKPGFGLTVARKLVEANGGVLRASSKPGVGTTVWFEMPARPVSDQAAVPLPEDEARVPGLRLLLVEDDELTAAATTAVLAVDGHDVVRAKSAARAAALAKRQRIDLVLMDLDLNETSGLDAIRSIRGLPDPVRAAVPIIVVSGDREQAEAARQSTFGIRSVLIKPFEVAELRRAIARVFGLGDRPMASPGGSAGFLADLAAVLPAHGLDALLETARTQIDGSLQALASAAAAGRLREAQRHAHRLAGSAGLLGFERLSLLARGLEEAARLRDRRTLAAMVTDARLAAAIVLSDLDGRLAPSPWHGSAAR